MATELEEYLEFKSFQKKRKEKQQNKSKKKKKSGRKNPTSENSVFKGVTDPKIINALDFYQEARSLERQALFQAVTIDGSQTGAHLRATMRNFDNKTKTNIAEIKSESKTYNAGSTGLMKDMALRPNQNSTQNARKKNTAGAWDIPNNRAFYPEDWDNIKAGSKWAGETTAKGASAFGKASKNMGKSTFEAGKDLFSWGKENKDHFGQEKRQERRQESRDRKREKWASRTKKLEDEAKQNIDNLKFKEDNIYSDNEFQREQENAKATFEKEKADFYKDTGEAQEKFDKRKAKRDFEFKREKVRTRQAEREFNENNPRKWFKGFRR